MHFEIHEHVLRDDRSYYLKVLRKRHNIPWDKMEEIVDTYKFAIYRFFMIMIVEL
jgi:hypothetical protein